MTALKDEETQKKGMVMVHFNIKAGWKQVFDTKLAKKIMKLRHAIPIHVAGLHYCFDDPTMAKIIGLVYLSLMKKELRARSRLHLGMHPLLCTLPELRLEL